MTVRIVRLPVCVSAEPLLGAVSAARLLTSQRLSFTAFVWPVFCASLEAAQASPVTIAARTRHATADTDRREFEAFARHTLSSQGDVTH